MQFIGRLDSWALNFVHPPGGGTQADFPAKIFKIITTLGEWWVILAITAIISGILIIKGKNIRTFILWLIVLGATADTFILKKIIHRPRPFDILVDEISFSFPSAHGALSIALYGFIAYLFWRSAVNKTAKIIIIITGIIFIAFIGFSRLYLGAHYLSDVLGGYILGAFWLALGVYILKQCRTSKLPDVRHCKVDES